MSHRQSCERCRQQKVRCLRDPHTAHDPSPGQTIPRCTRCAKAGTTCVYSLRSRVRRPESSRGSISQQNNLPSATDKYPTPFDSMDEDSNPYRLDFDGLGWDHLSAFPSMEMGMDGQPQRGVDHPAITLDMNHGSIAGTADCQGDRGWPSVILSPLSSGPKSRATTNNSPPSNSLQSLALQTTAISTQALAATRMLLCPGSTPPAASSVHVNEMFEATRTLVCIINNVVALASGTDDSNDSDAPYNDAGCKSRDIGGLIMTALAGHQHLLALFRAVCYSVEQCLESAADEKRSAGSDSSPVAELPSTAQYTMLLQLLIHLISRLDRCLFPAKPSTPVSSSTSTYGCGSSGSGMDDILVEKDSEDLPSEALGLPGLAQALVRSMPGEHLRLRQTILQLQARMESLEAF